jgi:hypothetical protein
MLSFTSVALTANTAQKTTNELTLHIWTMQDMIHKLQLASMNQKKFVFSFHSFPGRTKLTDRGFIFHSPVQHVSCSDGGTGTAQDIFPRTPQYWPEQ